MNNIKKDYKTTFVGAAQLVGWILLGIALYADLSGQPKSPTLANMGLCGAIILGVGAFLKGFFSADAKDGN